VFIALALAGGLAACGDDKESESAQTATTTVRGEDAIDVTMTDYAFAVSGNLKPGGTISLSNAGKEFHLMALGRLKEGKTVADLVTVLESGPPPEAPTTTAATGSPTTTAATESTTTTAQAAPEEEEDPTAEIIDEVGAPGTFMGPGQKADITVPSFGAGTYALICFLPTEGGGPPHFAKGMVGQLTVVGEKAAEPTADATFKVEAGKPITGPSTLTAGKHILKFEAAPGPASDQLEPGLAKLDEGKTVADVNQGFETLFATDEAPLNAAALIPAKLLASLFDFGPARTVYVGVDLTPGTYGVVANDTDPDDALIDPIEKTTFTVA